MNSLSKIRRVVRPRVHGEHFVDADFSGGHFTDAVIEQTRFKGCRLYGSTWDGSVLRGVEFIECDLRGASFRSSTLENTTFDASGLVLVSFEKARIDRTRFLNCDLKHVRIAGAIFQDCDIAPFERNAARALDGPVLDWRTVCRSLRANNLVSFLVGYGMPEVIATYLVESAMALDPELLFRLMRTTFISYGGPDIQFAYELRNRLHKNGVRTFFFEVDAVAGERLHHVMRNGVNQYDRIILVCSSASLTRPGVRNEIEETLAREARDGGATYLIPITLDDFVFSWRDPLARPILDRVVADFRGYEESRVFGQAISRLLRALRVE